jgi:hypothetical protein
LQYCFKHYLKQLFCWLIFADLFADLLWGARRENHLIIAAKFSARG